ncbi:MAG: hypothetical protein U0R44_05975 [Candidatus Micrarchaeia archaeon]
MGSLRDRVKGKAGASKGSDHPPAQKAEPLLEKPAKAERIDDLAEVPSAVAMFTSVVDEKMIDSVRESSPAPKMPPTDYVHLAPEAVLAIARLECQRRGINDEDSFMFNPDLKELFKAVAKKGVLEQVFSAPRQPPPPRPSGAPPSKDAATKVENISAPRTARPPPPPPPSVRVGRDAVSGEEPTMASDQIPAKAALQGRAGLPPRPPLPAISRIATFLAELDKDKKLDATQLYEKVQERYDEEGRLLLARYGNDMNKLREVLMRTKEKASEKMESNEPLTTEERHILDFIKLNEKLKEFKKKVDGKREVDALLAAKRNSMAPAGQSPGKAPEKSPGRIADPSPGKKDPSPGRKSKPPSQPPPLKRDSVAPKSGEPAVASERKSSPPPAVDSKPPSALTRFFLSPSTWAVAGIGAFSAAMYATGGFDDLAHFIGLAANRFPSAGAYLRKLHLDTQGGAQALYFGLSGFSLAVGRLVKFRRIRARVRELEALGIGEENFQKMRDYVVPILYSTLQNYAEGTSPTKLRLKMIEDERFFQYMEEFHKDAKKFMYIMEAARVPRSVVKRFHAIFTAAEAEIVNKRLVGFVKDIDDPELRMQPLREAYKEEFFMRKLDEVFAKSQMSGEYINKNKQTELASTMGRGDAVEGLRLFKELEKDYIRLTHKKA